ncbi:helix-turn-helix domain-containing protein [Pseudomonas sp. WOUb67]|uniref:helix-turn-helix domain-containing protein n=1 Tax=Pseudomonas sp. WOUb67 TaxID=3161136 RepID=UPI003CECF665
MRPTLEAVAIEPSTSWSFTHRELKEGIPFEWHYHPEYELTLTLNSEGYRYIGDDVSEYGDADLVLLRAGTPHSWRSVSEIRKGAGHQVVVVKFSQLWLDQMVTTIPEMAEIKDLFNQPFQALQFSGLIRKRVIPLLLGMLDRPSSQRFIKLLEVLLELASDRSTTVIGTSAIASISKSGETKILKALGYLHENFHRSIKISEVADVACLSVSGFQRMFKRHTNTCPVDYLMSLRVAKACALLVGTDQPVSFIAYSVGYSNISLFNRQFFKLKCETPKSFRNRHAMPRWQPEINLNPQRYQ